jgi:hypothetical protein
MGLRVVEICLKEWVSMGVLALEREGGEGWRGGLL